MVQLSPDNGGKAGYDHDNTRIDGFSHTHLSGVGCGALGEVRVMPTTGAVASSDPRSFGSHYAHDTETARPGYYAVDLTKYGVRAELSATTRTGWHRYSFPPTARANVLFDVGRANMPVRSSTHPGHRRPDARGLRPGRRLLRLVRPPPRLLLRALRPPVRAHRDVARRAPHPGRPPERGGSRAQRRLGAVRHDGGPERRPPGRHLLREPRRRAAQPRGGGRRARASTRWRARPRGAGPRCSTARRSTAARPTAASPSRRRSTTPSCTPT